MGRRSTDKPGVTMAAGRKAGLDSAVKAGGRGVLFATSDNGPGAPRDGADVIGKGGIGAFVEPVVHKPSLIRPIGSGPVDRAVDIAAGLAVGASRQAGGGRR